MECFKNGNDCPYRFICKEKLEDGSCSDLCPRIHEIDKLFSNANIPRKYLQPYKLVPDKIDVNSYELLNEIKNNIYEIVSKDILNLYIYSKTPQNGKTSWSIKILQNYLHKIWKMPGERKEGLYIDVGDYLNELKISFRNNDNNMTDFERDIDKADLVIWDNLDSYNLSEWDKNNLKQHIKKRLANNLSNIFVGSSIDNELCKIVGSDLKYYIQDNSIIIPLKGKRGDII